MAGRDAFARQMIAIDTFAKYRGKFPTCSTWKAFGRACQIPSTCINLYQPSNRKTSDSSRFRS